MRKFIILAICTAMTMLMGEEKEVLRFGAITTVKPEIVQQHFAPLLEHLGQKLGKKIVFATGRDYDDTI